MCSHFLQQKNQSHIVFLQQKSVCLRVYKVKRPNYVTTVWVGILTLRLQKLGKNLLCCFLLKELADCLVEHAWCKITRAMLRIFSTALRTFSTTPTQLRIFSTAPTQHLKYLLFPVPEVPRGQYTSVKIERRMDVICG